MCCTVFFSDLSFWLKYLRTGNDTELSYGRLQFFFGLCSQLPVLRAMENPDDYDIDTNLGVPIDEGEKTGT
jgi:hypothetical protein